MDFFAIESNINVLRASQKELMSDIQFIKYLSGYEEV